MKSTSEGYVPPVGSLSIKVVVHTISESGGSDILAVFLYLYKLVNHFIFIDLLHN